MVSVLICFVGFVVVVVELLWLFIWVIRYWVSLVGVGWLKIVVVGSVIVVMVVKWLCSFMVFKELNFELVNVWLVLSLVVLLCFSIVVVCLYIILIVVVSCLLVDWLVSWVVNLEDVKSLVLLLLVLIWLVVVGLLIDGVGVS